MCVYVVILEDCTGLQSLLSMMMLAFLFLGPWFHLVCSQASVHFVFEFIFILVFKWVYFVIFRSLVHFSEDYSVMAFGQ